MHSANPWQTYGIVEPAVVDTVVGDDVPLDFCNQKKHISVNKPIQQTQVEVNFVLLLQCDPNSLLNPYINFMRMMEHLRNKLTREKRAKNQTGQDHWDRD